MDSVWSCGAILGHLFVIVNLLGQLVPSGFILARKFAEYNLYVLFGIVVLQVSYGLAFYLIDFNYCLHFHLHCLYLELSAKDVSIAFRIKMFRKILVEIRTVPRHFLIVCHKLYICSQCESHFQ